MRAYLEQCAAVESIHESDGILNFTFDPSKAPTDVPEGAADSRACAMKCGTGRYRESRARLMVSSHRSWRNARDTAPIQPRTERRG